MDDDHPIVLRFEELTPGCLGRMQMHANRAGGYLDHCDPDRTNHTKWYREIGNENFAKGVREEIRVMSKLNLDRELEALDRLNRKADKNRRQEKGLCDPFRASKGGPLREVLLTANAEYYMAEEGDPDPYVAHRTNKDGVRERFLLSRKKIDSFERYGLKFFKDLFPGQLRHLRLDMDEEVPHFHALVLVSKEKTSKNLGTQINIVPSANPLIRRYEHAQNVAGEYFGCIGLVRGERRAEARRNAKELGNPAPEDRKHTTPAEHRAERAEAIRLREVDAEYLEEVAYWEAENTKQEAVEAADKIRQEADAIRAEALRQQKLNEQYIERYDDALEAGLAAVDDGVISYQPSSGTGKQDTLSFGPSAPKDDEKRAILKAKWQPALKVIKKYARRIWSSEAAQCERQFKADPSLVDVQVNYNPDAEPQSDDILKMDVKVSLDKIKGLSKPMKRILGGIANVIATQVGNAAIKLARSKLRDELAALSAYRVQHRQQYGTVDPKAEAKMSLREQGLENMMAKAPDPRNAERLERQDRRVKGDKMDR